MGTQQETAPVNLLGTPSAELKLPPAEEPEQGLQIQALSAGDCLIARTANGAYQVTVLAPTSRQVLVYGEPFFPHPVNARLDGCSLGGAFLRLGGLAVGCAIEFRTESGVVVTAPVRSIAFVEHR